MILTFYEYLYYRGVLFYNKHEDKHEFDDHKNRGTWITATYFYLNLLTLISFIFDFLFFDLHIRIIKTDAYLFSVIGLYLVIFFSSMYLFEKKRHDKIFEKFSNEDAKTKELRGVLIVVYFIVSIALLTLSALPVRNEILGSFPHASSVIKASL